MARTHEEKMAAQRLWRAANPERIKAYNKAASNDRAEYRKAHRAEKAAYDREYRKTHPRKDSKELQKAWAEANREKRSAQARARRLANLEKVRAAEKARKALRPPEERVLHEARRRARKRGAGGNYTVSDTRRIRKAQKGKCAYCRQPLGNKPHLDHIMPLAKGGSNAAANLQWLCADCNYRKSAKDPIVFARSIGRLL